MRVMKVQGTEANSTAQATSTIRPEDHDAGKPNDSAAGKPGKIALRAQQRLARLRKLRGKLPHLLSKSLELATIHRADPIPLPTSQIIIWNQ